MRPSKPWLACGVMKLCLVPFAIAAVTGCKVKVARPPSEPTVIPGDVEMALEDEFSWTKDFSDVTCVDIPTVKVGTKLTCKADIDHTSYDIEVTVTAIKKLHKVKLDTKFARGRAVRRGVIVDEMQKTIREKV